MRNKTPMEENSKSYILPYSSLYPLLFGKLNIVKRSYSVKWCLCVSYNILLLNIDKEEWRESSQGARESKNDSKLHVEE